MLKYWTNGKGRGYCTHGCGNNLLEINRLYELLSMYHKEFFIINTCAVIEPFEQTCRTVTKHISELNPDVPLFITGCASEYDSEYFKQFGHVIPNAAKLDPAQYNCTGKQLFVQESINKLYDTQVPISIQHGCNNNCSYCITAKLRGPSASKSPNKILDELQEAVAATGCTSIRLVGTDETQYRYLKCSTMDDSDELVIHECCMLSDLCKMILKCCPRITKLTLDFLDPASPEIDKLIEMMRTDSRMDKMLYLGTQHGSDRILKSMRRRHTRQRILDIHDMCKDDILILHDTITGYPGETEDDFEELLSLFDRPNIKANLRIYSPREGTDAATYDDQIPEAIKLARMERLRHAVQFYERQPIDSMKIKRIDLYHEGDQIERLLELHSAANTTGHLDDYNTLTFDNTLLQYVKLDDTAKMLLIDLFVLYNDWTKKGNNKIILNEPMDSVNDVDLMKEILDMRGYCLYDNFEVNVTSSSPVSQQNIQKLLDIDRLGVYYRGHDMRYSNE